MRKSGWFLPACDVVFLGVLVTASACPSAPSTPAPDPAPESSGVSADGHDQGLMISIVDPSADIVWLSVTTVRSAKGTVDTAPKNEEERKIVRKGAVALAEAANILIMPGRHIAAPWRIQKPLAWTRAVGDGRADQQGWRRVGDAPASCTRPGLKRSKLSMLTYSQKVFEVGDRSRWPARTAIVPSWLPNEQIPPVPASTQ